MRIIETCPVCGHDLKQIPFRTVPPRYRKECTNCGWSWTGDGEATIRMPFFPPRKDSENQNKTCEHCSNNPKNGGSGICFCIMGTPNLY